MHALRAFVTLSAALFVSAEIYVTQPASGDSCHGGKSCTVSWVDNGVPPLLSSIGVVRVGLYTGDLQLVQTIVPVDVSTSHSLTFTPNPQAGPNSGAYYVAFISSDGSYHGYTPNFALDGMSGSFSSPDPSATSGIAVPSSLTYPSGSASGSTTPPSARSTTVTGTSLSGASSGTSGAGTSTLASTRLPSSSGTSSLPTSSSPTTTFSTQATITPSSAAVATGPATGFAWTLLAALGFVLF
ncbi:hypothetical protein F5887DRAFT_6100 [Amanita rubescens]|nr:hypothetical protein F5887DRAFT_6100 [Amanita rubescens]